VEKPLNEDPLFKLSDIEVKVKRVEAVLTRVSNIPKPKEEKKKKEDKIKIENINIDGDSDLVDEFIKMNKGDQDEKATD